MVDSDELEQEPPDISDLLKVDKYFRIKKSRKTKKESLVLSIDAKEDLDKYFESLAEFFNGDLMQVKDYANKFGKEQKALYDQDLISESEYKKSLLLASSIRGKATYKAYKNYVYTKNSEKITSKFSGLRGIFYSKKAAAEDAVHLNDSVQDPVSVMKEWSKLKKEDGNKSNQDVWISAQKYEKARLELEKYWTDKGALLDQDSQRLLAEANISPKALKKAKGKLSQLATSWKKKIVLGAFSLGILFGGIKAAQAKIQSTIQSQAISAATEQFYAEWSAGSEDPDPISIATNIENSDELEADESENSEEGLAGEGESETDLTDDVSKEEQISEESSVSEEVTATPEKIEKIQTLELLRKYYTDSVLPGRINHLNNLSKEDRQKIFESIGGPENIDNGLVTIAILGKDTTGDRFGADKDGNPLGRNDQSVVVIIDINNNQISVVSIPRTIAIPAGMYGKSTPDNINGLTWIDQAHPTQDGGYVPLDREIAQRVITDAVGYYLDGMVEFDFESTATLIDSLFPDGVKIEMSDSFVPENDVLGRISGWKKGGYKPFVEGKTYRFNGEAIVALLRARETRKEGAYQRESDASRVIAQLIEQMVKEFLSVDTPQALGNRIESIKLLAESTEQLEDSGNLRAHFWGERQRPTSILLNVLSSVGLDAMWNTAKSYQIHGEDILPTFAYFSPAAEDMVAAPGRDHHSFFESGIDENDPYKHQRNPLKFWDSLRQKVKSLVKGRS